MTKKMMNVRKLRKVCLAAIEIWWLDFHYL